MIFLLFAKISFLMKRIKIMKLLIVIEILNQIKYYMMRMISFTIILLAFLIVYVNVVKKII